MHPDRLDPWETWVLSKPAAVQVVARKYPLATRFNCHGKVMHVISYDEFADGTVGLGVTPIDPGENYALAVAKKQTVCACCTGKLDSLILP